MWASQWNHFEVVKLLIERGANVNATDCHGWSALMTASAQGNTTIVKFLLENGAKTHFREKLEFDRGYGQTALEMAQQCKHSDIIALLSETSN